ncbi:MAG: hypothetical protein ABR498_00715 [Candidatus Dormibacteria bacterium]
MPSPAVTVAYTYPYGVDCASAQFCVAAGSNFDASTNGEDSVLAAYEGSAWHAVAPPDAASTDGLRAVHCGSASFCAAVGANVALGAATLIDEWDGTSWTVATSPNPSGNSALYGVSCLNDGFCMAVGAYNLVSTPAGAISQTLIEERGAEPAAGVPEAPAVPILVLVGAVFAYGSYRLARLR